MRFCPGAKIGLKSSFLVKAEALVAFSTGMPVMTFTAANLLERDVGDLVAALLLSRRVPPSLAKASWKNEKT